MPRISVIIPTYNRARFLGRAIESVMAQSYRDFEVIVIDDGSTDSTREVVGAFSTDVWYYYQENSGFSASRNRGIALARGEYITFLDSDDVLLEDALQLGVEVLESHPDVGYVYGRAYYVDERDHIISVKKSATFEETCVLDGKDQIRDMLFTYRIPINGVMVRRRCFESGAEFDEGLSYIAEDLLLFIRIAKKCSVGYIAKPLSSILIHSGNTCRTPNPYQAERSYLAVLQEIFEDPELAKRFAHLKRKVYSHYYWIIAENAYRADMRMCRSYLIMAIRARPRVLFSERGFKCLHLYLKSFVPIAVGRILKRFKSRFVDLDSGPEYYSGYRAQARRQKNA